MSFIKTAGIIYSKQDENKYTKRRDSELMTKLVALHHYLSDVDELDYHQNVNIELFQIYGICTNNSYILSSSYSTLQKIYSEFKNELITFTKNNIVRMCKKIFDDIVRFNDLLNINNSKIILNTNHSDISSLKLENEKLLSIIRDYNKNTDLSKFNIGNIKTKIQVLNSLFKNFELGITSLQDEIITNMKSLIYMYTIYMLQSNPEYRNQQHSPILGFNPYDVIIDNYEFESFIKMISNRDPDKRDVIAIANNILSLGSYSKTVLWNIISLTILEYSPLYVNKDLSYTLPENKVLLEAILLLLQR